MEIINRRAKFDYFIDEAIEAGIVLTGTEIKSIRNGSANIKDSYAIIKNNEVFLLNISKKIFLNANLVFVEERKNMIRDKQ